MSCEIYPKIRKEAYEKPPTVQEQLDDLELALCKREDRDVVLEIFQNYLSYYREAHVPEDQLVNRMRQLIIEYERKRAGLDPSSAFVLSPEYTPRKKEPIKGSVFSMAIKNNE